MCTFAVYYGVHGCGICLVHARTSRLFACAVWRPFCRLAATPEFLGCGLLCAPKSCKEFDFWELDRIEFVWLAWSQIAESTDTWLWQSKPCQVAYPIISWLKATRRYQKFLPSSQNVECGMACQGQLHLKKRAKELAFTRQMANNEALQVLFTAGHELGVQPWQPFHTLTPPSRHHTKHGIWLCVTAVCALQNAAICFQAKLQNRCSHLRGDRSCFRCGRSNIEPKNSCALPEAGEVIYFLPTHNSLLHIHSCRVWHALPQTWFYSFSSAVSNLLILQDTGFLKY